MALSEGFHARAREYLARYPDKRSAILMILHEAQDEVGYVSSEVIREIADLLDLSSADVAGVVTFHTMFKRKPQGRYLISLCTNVGCAVYGADDAAVVLTEVVGPEHEGSEDGMLCWESVECLAACHRAPAAQVNYRDIRYLTPDRARKLCSALREGRSVDDVVAEFRAADGFSEAQVSGSQIRGPGAPSA